LPFGRFSWWPHNNFMRHIYFDAVSLHWRYMQESCQLVACHYYMQHMSKQRVAIQYVSSVARYGLFVCKKHARVTKNVCMQETCHNSVSHVRNIHDSVSMQETCQPNYICWGIPLILKNITTPFLFATKCQHNTQRFNNVSICRFVNVPYLYSNQCRIMLILGVAN